MDRQTHSLWMETPAATFPALDSDLETDVCIVGRGITGLTCAYTLIKHGKKVVIIDKDPLICGQTIRTTAHLTWLLDTRYFELEKLFKQDKIQLVIDSHAGAIEYIEKIVQDEKIDCNFERVSGYLFLPKNQTSDVLYSEYNAVHKLGKEVSLVFDDTLKGLNLGMSLHFPNQAQFHIQKYMLGLIKYIQENGGKFFDHTAAESIKDGQPCEIVTSIGHKILSKAVIVATCTPMNDRFLLQTKQAAYRTYVIASLIPKDIMPKGLFWDTEDPYHYIRLQSHQTDPEKEWLIIGGEDHRTGQEPHAESKYDKLEAWAKKYFPIKEIQFRWSGQVFEPVDGLAYIGRNPTENHVYITTGNSGNGMTYGTISGMLIPDLIMGKENPLKAVYEPSRKNFKAITEYLSEQLNTSIQYLDWFTNGDKAAIEKLPSGEGMIIRKGIKKLAIYKDFENQIHIFSAFCPHLGGCVRWNSGEKTWDCPCHGSRFSCEGEVITGPANSSLYPCPMDLK